MNLPEITEVQRLVIKPGDRLIVRTEEILTAQDAAHLTEIVRDRLRIGDDVPVFILGRGMRLGVLEKEMAAK